MYSKSGLQLFDPALEMVLIFDAFGKITYANKMAQSLLEYEDLRKTMISEIFPEVFSVESGSLLCKGKIPEGGSIVYPPAMEAGETPDNTADEMAYRGNRTCFTVKMKAFPMEEGDGEPYQNKMTICMALDASKQTYFERRVNIADARMENAEQLKSQFVANVTHELRTPVNGIQGNVLALQKMEEDPAKKQVLALIERGCRDMHAIINNILDFSKLEAGKIELERKEFVFRDLMEYVKSTHINKIAEKGLDFFMNISSEIPETVIGDELRIGQILNNFLSNATKFTISGRITVEVVKTAQMGNRMELFFMVIDTGIGIDKENQDKLFRSFSQVEASISRKFGGTGLGLNISKQLVEMMGGNVHVESEKNKGSMFSFHIWVEVPAGVGDANDGRMHSYGVEIPAISVLQDMSKTNEFGTAENLEEIEKKLSKLVLCIEMENWEKAEMFMEAVKQLTFEAPGPVKSSMLRLKMSVQKADRDKAVEALEVFRQNLASSQQSEIGGY